MNLANIANAAIASVNPNFIGQVKSNAGYTTADDGTRSPVFAVTAGVPMQVQALTSRELDHIDGLNVQDIVRAIYVNGQLEGLDRPDVRGGDLLLAPTGMTLAALDTWLVRQVIEGWDAGGWCKVAAVLQNPPLSQ
jgi:hypothetical protein